MSYTKETFKDLLLQLLADARSLAEAKREVLELQMVEKATPKLARAIVATLALKLISLLMLLLVLSAGFALGQWLVCAQVLAPFTYALLLSAGVVALLLIIIVVARKAIFTGIEATVINSYLNKKEKEEAEQLEEELNNLNVRE